ncbi:GDP-6-deoxy-D-mannose reductase [Mycobacterium sp. shizuoka-1]|nr:GDP-6-deoxy-D-mannose reductase [Mycobacterium sp. shizuoka-1]
MVSRLCADGYRVVGISERPEPPPTIADILDDYCAADLTAGWPVTGPVGGIIHLAGLAAVGPSFDHPQDYLATNSAMVTHLFEWALAEQWNGRALIVSSGAVYGGELDGHSFTEESPVVATSPYVVSKLLVELQTEYYRRRGIDAVMVRPFNHIGPGQRPGFIVPDLAARLAEWQPGSALPVGNLDSARDYTDVRDIAVAYRMLLELPAPQHSTYNVCSGTSRSGWEILAAVCAALGKPVPPTTGTTQRSIDPSVIVGNAERLSEETGWTATVDLQKSIHDFVTSVDGSDQARSIDR